MPKKPECPKSYRDSLYFRFEQKHNRQPASIYEALHGLNIDLAAARKALDSLEREENHVRGNNPEQSRLSKDRIRHALKAYEQYCQSQAPKK